MIVTNSENVGRLVRQRRQDQRLSQADLAERAGITRQLLSRFEHGKSDPQLAVALRLLRELGLSLDARTREQRASIVEIPVPRLEGSALQVRRLDLATIEALQRTLIDIENPQAPE